MRQISTLAVKGIQLAQFLLFQKKIIPHLHFEWEGGYIPDTQSNQINYKKINYHFNRMDIPGKLIPEYWSHQWEYVSEFSGQTPLEESHYMTKVLAMLPILLKQNGARKILIKPILWNGDKGRFETGSKTIFNNTSTAVHIPNAVQLNISLEKNRKNLLAEGNFALHLQNRLLETSYGCCLLYLPDEESYQRLTLKDHFNLSEELSSPDSLSGGRQGSIALYRELGKHGQAIGDKPLLLNAENQVIARENNWHKYARIEHRLGASSLQYNPYLNILYGLMTIIDTLANVDLKSSPTEFDEKILPTSLADSVRLFKKDSWFNRQLNQLVLLVKDRTEEFDSISDWLGDELKWKILQHYQQKIVL